jgi:hypothetical protein
MEKRGQVFIFIVIAILIVSVILIYFLIRNKDIHGVIDPDIAPIYSFIENCIIDDAEYSIKQIGEYGGVTIDPLFGFSTNPYFSENGILRIKSISEIEDRISTDIDIALSFCIMEPDNFLGFNINSSDIITKTIIEDEKVTINVNYPLKITKGTKTYYIKEFKDIEIPIRLGRIFAVANNITKKQSEYSGDLCISCIDEMSVINDLYIQVYNYDTDVKLFVIIDENSKIGNESYKFKFLNKWVKNE